MITLGVSIMIRFSWVRRWLLGLMAFAWGFCLWSGPVWAEDRYVTNFLQVTDTVAIPLNQAGETQSFSAEDLSEGKELFLQNCMNCHVGGANLPFPTVSLSLTALAGATPPRNNLTNLVGYMRHPMVYDGSEETYWCREVTESWMSQEKIENLAAFILRAAEKAPGWGAPIIDQ